MAAIPPSKSAAMTPAALKDVSFPYNPMPLRPALACASRTCRASERTAIISHGDPGTGSFAHDGLQNAVNNGIDDFLLRIGLVNSQEHSSEQGEPVGPP